MGRAFRGKIRDQKFAGNISKAIVIYAIQNSNKQTDRIEPLKKKIHALKHHPAPSNKNQMASPSSKKNKKMFRLLDEV